MKIYTKTGDAGTTGLFGGGRVPKHHPRVEAYGDLDELNSHIGLACAHLVAAAAGSPPPRQPAQQALATLVERLTQVQADLLTLGAQFAASRPPAQRVAEADVQRLEAWIDESEAALPALTNFILPGGTVAAAALHLCRTVCRRTERKAWRVYDDERSGEPADGGTAAGGRKPEPLDPIALRYLNRLSDLFFSWGRLANHYLGVADAVWAPREA